MGNTSSTTVLLAFTISLLALWVTGCGQDDARVAQLKADKDKLEGQIAELQAGKVDLVDLADRANQMALPLSTFRSRQHS